jgi:peptidoglycan hydrolase-like protein with peptidoglycan-binding domain
VRGISLVLVAIAIAGVVCDDAAALAKVQVPGVQVALYRYGYYKGPIDGIAGPQTAQALRAFQRSKGLEPDGIAGRRTRAAFGRLGTPLFGGRMLKRGMVGFDVSVLQFLLAKRGFSTRYVNSNFGSVTERQVRRFQEHAGLSVDGIVGRRTRAALISGHRGRRHTRAARSSARTRHLVRPGETLTSIAAQSGTTVSALASRNRLDPGGLLLVGTRLVVPTARAPVSQGGVVASLNSWAAHYGVSPELARALAWQESGFQNDVRSGAGAVGVMQVIPATWFFVERFVIGDPIARTADGNVRVGVAYFRHLTEEFRGDVRAARAAYHQGPASVRRRGPSRETRRFVANVLALRGRV